MAVICCEEIIVICSAPEAFNLAVRILLINVDIKNLTQPHVNQ